MKTTWTEGIKKTQFQKLKSSLSCDVVIIGGGLVGIQSAYFLSKAGKKVIVLEKNTLGSDATQHTTAFITFSLDTSAKDLVSMFGKSDSRKIYESGKNAINNIEKVIREENIDCDFMRCSNYTYSSSEDEFKNLSKEATVIKELGFDVSLGKKDLGIPQKGYLELKNQAKFHPLKYLYAVAEAAKKNGTQIFEHTEATKITRKGNVINVETKDGQTIKAGHVINATYDPLGNPVKTLFKKGMYVSYVFEIEIPSGLIKEGTYEDMENPYHYFRVDKAVGKDRMIFGGADHRSELKMDPKKNYKALREYLDKLLPRIKYEVTKKWIGPILEPSDGLPLIGEYKTRSLVATAFSGNGMIYSMIAASMFNDLILGRKNLYTKIYDPKRIPSAKQLLKKGLNYGEEFFKGAVKNAFK
jgi:glycine/D-amino acid oxidase-like deaminating enzyme